MSGIRSSRPTRMRTLFCRGSGLEFNPDFVAILVEQPIGHGHACPSTASQGIVGAYTNLKKDALCLSILHDLVRRQSRAAIHARSSLHRLPATQRNHEESRQCDS
jgi:hypothetical protein